MRSLGKIIKSSSIGITAYKLNGTTCVWRKPIGVDSGLQCFISDAEFVDALSYVSREYMGECVGNQSQVCKPAYLERYGGIGVGCHGGGGRCISLEGFQVKGSGKNCLVGANADPWHAHGRLSLGEATVEAIYSEVLSKLLPHGVVRVVGILGTGNDSAFSCTDKEGVFSKCPGALLIREGAVRPAHFMASPEYVAPNGSEVVPSDIQRLRIVFKNLGEVFPSEGAITLELIRSLKKLSEQFAFASVMRIAHGAISDSNIALNGRWLDLSNASFVPGGINARLSPTAPTSFYGEKHEALSIINRLVYTCNKFRRENILAEELEQFYNDELSNNLLIYFGFVIGLDATVSSGLHRTKEYRDVYEFFQRSNLGYERPRYISPDRIDSGDPVIRNLLAVFKSAFGCMRGGEAEVRGVGESILSLVFELRKSEDSSGYSSGAWVTSLSIIALKRAYFSEIFYLGRIWQAINSTETNMEAGCSSLIEESAALAGWCFEGISEGKVDILLSGPVSVQYDVLRSKYIVSELASRYMFDDADSCLSYLMHNSPCYHSVVKVGCQLSRTCDKILENMVNIEGSQ